MDSRAGWTRPCWSLRSKKTGRLVGQPDRRCDRQAVMTAVAELAPALGIGAVCRALDLWRGAPQRHPTAGTAPGLRRPPPSRRHAPARAAGPACPRAPGAARYPQQRALRRHRTGGRARHAARRGPLPRLGAHDVPPAGSQRWQPRTPRSAPAPGLQQARAAGAGPQPGLVVGNHQAQGPGQVDNGWRQLPWPPCCLTKECYPSVGCRFGPFRSSFHWSKAVGMWSKAAAVGNAGRAAARCPRSQPVRHGRIVHMSIAWRARSARPPCSAAERSSFGRHLVRHVAGIAALPHDQFPRPLGTPSFDPAL